jgi:hypothetical protein
MTMPLYKIEYKLEISLISLQLKQNVCYNLRAPSTVILSQLTQSQASSQSVMATSTLGKLHPMNYPNTTEKKNENVVMKNVTPASPKSQPIVLEDDVSVFELEL